MPNIICLNPQPRAQKDKYVFFADREVSIGKNFALGSATGRKAVIKVTGSGQFFSIPNLPACK